jgi:hypothetical protein
VAAGPGRDSRSVVTDEHDEEIEMSELGRGRVAANGITFEYLEAGEGPLALCMHGFPDSPFTYRYLLPNSRGPASTPWRRSSADSRPPSCPRCATTCTPA